jgi:transposase
MSRIQGKDHTDSTSVYVGIDVCKAWLDIHVLGAGRDAGFRVANTDTGIAELLRRLDGVAVARAALEATGRMHHAVWTALDGAGVAVIELNPYRSRKFADALGLLAKTDAIDARLLALTAASLSLAPSRPPSQEARQIKELQALRRNLVARRTALLNQLASAGVTLVRNLLKAEQRGVERHIARVEAELLARIGADPRRARSYEILVSIPGIGPASACALIADLPELGAASDKEIAALVGVAPMNWESGNLRGRRRIKGGRAPLRAALQMAALVAARAIPDLANLRKRLLAAGKHHRAALTAVLRKLLIIANALIRDNRKWTPQRP